MTSRISNVKVYELEESMVSGGYPMSVELGCMEYETKNLKYWLGKNLPKIEKILTSDGRFKLNGDSVVMSISNEVETTISPEDLIRVSEHNWTYGNVRGYVRSANGKFELHRFILDFPDGECVDHIDRNKLNNTRGNLRTCTHRENTINRGLISTNTSGFTGVYYRKDRDKWYVKLEFMGKKLNFGNYATKEEAIKARLTAEKEYYGQFAPQRHLFKEYGIHCEDDGTKFTPSLERALKHYKRSRALGKSEKASGHDQMLTGIRVAFDLRFSNKAWVELERYHFVDFVSSQSTMHRIAKFDLDGQYNEYVDPVMINRMKELVDIYNETHNPEDYLTVLYSNPAGFELTARLTTNYRALKTVYFQRKTHKLPEWREVCYWIESLPLFKELVLGVYDEETTGA